MKEQEAIEMLKSMQNPLQDYANMVGAPAFAYGCKYVYPEPEDYAIEEAITALEEKQNRRWIPVSERMPAESSVEADADEATPVLVTYLGYYSKQPYSGGLAIWCDDNKWRWYDDTKDVETMDDVIVDIIAWMPLPEPYKQDN